MFLNAFQQGQYFEVFDPKEVGNKGNKEKQAIYSKLFKVNNTMKVQKIFDPQLKGFLFILEGQSTKMQFPKSGDLGLIQQFLVLQVYIYQGYIWTLEIDVTDITKTKRRIVLTDSVKTLEQHHFHLKSSIDHLRRNQWLNLCIDVWSFMEGFKGCTFRSIDSIIISAPCKLRKIYLMKNPIEDSEIEITFTQGFMLVPKQVNFPEWFAHNNQLLTYRLLNYNEFILSQQIQHLPDNPLDKYLYNSKQQSINVQSKIGQFKYSKQEQSVVESTKQKQEFKQYQTKNTEEKMNSKDGTYLQKKENDSSYFREFEQKEEFDDEQLDNFLQNMQQNGEYLNQQQYYDDQ